MLEKRKSSRKPAFLGGTITYNRDLWSANCVVRNFSEQGARLTGRNLPALPDRFDLTIPQRKTRYRAHICWRDGDVIGVEFEQVIPCDEAPAKDRGADKGTDRRARILRASVFGDDVAQGSKPDSDFAI